MVNHYIIQLRAIQMLLIFYEVVKSKHTKIFLKQPTKTHLIGMMTSNYGESLYMFLIFHMMKIIIMDYLI